VIPTLVHVEDLLLNLEGPGQEENATVLKVQDLNLRTSGGNQQVPLFYHRPTVIWQKLTTFGFEQRATGVPHGAQV
jgi:hypothetical protein